MKRKSDILLPDLKVIRAFQRLACSLLTKEGVPSVAAERSVCVSQPFSSVGGGCLKENSYKVFCLCVLGVCLFF